MDCAEIRSGFVAGGVPAGPDAEAHLRACAACSELFANGAALGRSLAVAIPPTMEPDALFAAIERDVEAETGPRAKLRAWPTWLRVGAFFSFAVALVAWHTHEDPRPALGYSPLALWSLMAALLLGLLWGARWLFRGPSQGSSRATRNAVVLALLALPALTMALAPLGATSREALDAWGSPGICFAYGALSGIPLLLLYWVFERRDRVPSSALVAAGALGGIAANALLHGHCASANLGHLLVGHATIGAGLALAIALLAWPFQRR